MQPNSNNTPEASSDLGKSARNPERRYFCANRLNLETMQWEYAPRYMTIERGRVVTEEAEAT